jgi:hypothetical protein
MTDQMAIKLAICLALFTGFLMAVIKLLEWRRRPETRPCKWFGHDRKYVAIKICGCVASNDPNASGRGFNCAHNHQIGDKGIYIARWVCTRCPEMVEECLGRDKDWMIEHGKLVPNVKRWANWSQDPPPPNNEAARQKLKEIKERIEAQERKDRFLCGACNSEHELDPEKCPKVTVKTEPAKDKVTCDTCGWVHTGPCNPARHCDRCKAEHTGSCPAL